MVPATARSAVIVLLGALCLAHGVHGSSSPNLRFATHKSARASQQVLSGSTTRKWPEPIVETGSSGGSGGSGSEAPLPLLRDTVLGVALAGMETAKELAFFQQYLMLDNLRGQVETASKRSKLLSLQERLNEVVAEVSSSPGRQAVQTIIDVQARRFNTWLVSRPPPLKKLKALAKLFSAASTDDHVHTIKLMLDLMGTPPPLPRPGTKDDIIQKLKLLYAKARDESYLCTYVLWSHLMLEDVKDGFVEYDKYDHLSTMIDRGMRALPIHTVSIRDTPLQSPLYTAMQLFLKKFDRMVTLHGARGESVVLEKLTKAANRLAEARTVSQIERVTKVLKKISPGTTLTLKGQTPPRFSRA